MDQNLIASLNVYDEKIKMTKLEKVLKIITPINTTNMVAFDRNNKIRKYNSANEILIDYIDTRLHYYNLRKINLINVLEEEIKFLSMKIRFIKRNLLVENSKLTIKQRL